MDIGILDTLRSRFTLPTLQTRAPEESEAAIWGETYAGLEGRFDLAAAYAAHQERARIANQPRTGGGEGDIESPFGEFTRMVMYAGGAPVVTAV